MDDSNIKKSNSTVLGMHRNSFVGDELDLASKQDLRKTKAELFNKLVGSQSQQLIVTPSKNNIDSNSLNGTSKDDHSIIQKQQQTSKEGRLGSSEEQNVFARTRSRWYTNEEVASILTSFSSHPEWQTNELQVRPQSGAVLLYSREKVRYRQDGYCWKKRKNGRTTREDHMKLKVQGIECIYGCYVHSAILPTFHRRCYWLLQNPDIVLVHYLNQPPDDQSRMMLTFNSSLLEADTRRSWTNEEIIEEIGSVFGGISQIHHTLSINFPPDDIIDLNQAAHPKDCSVDNSSMIEMSPQSQATSHSEVITDQNDLNVTENQRMICSSESQDKDLNNNNDKKSNISQADRTTIDEDELMAVSQESSSRDDDQRLTSNIEQITDGSSDDRNSNLNCAVQVDCNLISRDAELIQPQQHDDPISMAFDLVSECRDNEMNGNEICGQRDRSTTSYKFVTGSTNSMSLDNLTTTLDTSSGDNGGNILQNSSSICSQQAVNQTDGQMDQGSCSPVTQIYNKIVDDIETYALPMEPNQFDSSHHHHHHHHHNMSISSSLPDQTMDLGGGSGDLQQAITNHPQMIGGTEEHPEQRQQHQQEQQHLFNHHPQQTHCQIQPEQQGPMVNAQHQFNESRGANQKEPNHDLSDHSVDFTSCDLFGECDLDEIEQSASGHDRSGGGGCNDSNILLTDFHLPGPDSGQVTDDLGGTVVDSMGNADDFRDLIMGMPSPSSMDINGEAGDQASNLLVDNNALDLFNFKSSSGGEHKHQIDVKSTTSETEALNRLSPMAPLVPRCNSTDNAMQPAGQRLDQFQHHLSSHYLAALNQQQHHHHQQHHHQQHHHQQHHHHNQHHHQQQHQQQQQQQQHDPLMGKTFSEYNHHNNLTAHRSAASTNPSNSTSCSPSPSSSSLITAGNPSSTRSAYLDGSHCSTGSSSNSFMKLPLQQRQKSEQREPSNSVLNTLLPKALSLDGSDLSTTRHHRNHLHNQHHYCQGLQSPMSPYMGPASQCERISQQQTNNLLLVPQSSNGVNVSGQQHSSSASPIGNQHQQPYYHPQRPGGPIHLSSIASASSMSVALIDSNQPQDNHYQHAHSNQNNPMLASNLCPLKSSTENRLDNHRQYVKMDQHPLQLNGMPHLLTIVDYVPNWTPSSGGTKVLLIANWKSIATNSRSIPSQLDGNTSNHTSAGGMVVTSCKSPNSRRLSLSTGLTSSSALAIKTSESPSGFGAGCVGGGFSVMFDSTIVPATLIQDNVLRCYSPAHEPGFISLKVLYMDRVVSEQVVFEVRTLISGGGGGGGPIDGVESVGLQQQKQQQVCSTSSSLLDEQQQQQQQQPRHNGGAFISGNCNNSSSIQKQVYHHQSETIKQ